MYNPNERHKGLFGKDDGSVEFVVLLLIACASMYCFAKYVINAPKKKPIQQSEEVIHVDLEELHQNIPAG